MSAYSVRMLSIDNKSLATNLDRAGYRKMGVHVTSRDSYVEAIKVLEEKEIDVIVVNVDYEGVDAFAVTQGIKADQRWAETAVILTSVRSSAAMKKKALNCGADLFVEQPVPRQYFIEKIKGLLEQQTRNTERVELDSGVCFSWDGGDYTQSINDLSVSGMLISADFTIPEGTKIELKFSIPNYKKPLKIEGEVARNIEYNEKHPDRLTGVGVKFVNFLGDAHRRLEKYVDLSSEKNSELHYYL